MDYQMMLFNNAVIYLFVRDLNINQIYFITRRVGASPVHNEFIVTEKAYSYVLAQHIFNHGMLNKTT